MKHFNFALISLFFLSCKDDNNCCLNSFKGNEFVNLIHIDDVIGIILKIIDIHGCFMLPIYLVGKKLKIR